ncbi:MAG TPA: DUF2330 domain-containing protein [Candidatus Paceibacterota bacterium]|nr:DUF2330 domain-containing protein [Candidatus Pacearchaeota archaeon]HRZ51448.1 DUF2330 domain-containing protein [Candidatus Paceibacterota bacterium]HSA37151.1 DUF2330 domain-containing protein [Candidatus Paceibacterota bacterium]
MKKIINLLLILIGILITPLSAGANGGMHHWPPHIYVSQTDQNAIVAWNGTEEILILSTNWSKPAESGEVTLLKTVPLPSNPSDIKEGDTEIFDRMVKVLNSKLPTWGEADAGMGSGTKAANTPSVEVVFQKVIGAHDVTVVKVNNPEEFSNWIDGFAAGKNLEKKQISEEFKNGLKSYLKRGINYFAFDVATLDEEKNSIKPLVYRFPTQYFYFPMLVSGVSEIAESQTRINLFLAYPKNMKLPSSIWQGSHDYSVTDNGFEIPLARSEVKEVYEPLTELFTGDVSVRRFQMYGKLSQINKDLTLFPQLLSSNLKVGMRSEDVKILQQLLINEGFWQSEASVTSYFGPATKAAVMRFQERYKESILYPLGLTAPTGFFGPYTRKYLNENIFVGVK